MSATLIPGSILSLPAEAADRLLRQDSGDCALLYLHLLRHGGIDGLTWEGPRLQLALEGLRQLGMAPTIQQVAPPPPTLPADQPAPTYSSQEIAQALEEQTSPFTLVADEVERQLGKRLTAADLKGLYALYDHLALPPEVILLLTTYCVEEHQRKFGQGRRPFVSAIRKEGFSWARQGIETVERAEEHLHKKAILRTREGAILQILDLPARPLVSREQAYVADWQAMGFPDEVIRLAYEKTVLKKGSLEWSYLNGILRRWHEKGLHTLSAVSTGDRDMALRAGQGGVPAPQPPAPQDNTARTDMDRMRRLMAEMKEKEASENGI